MNVLDVGKPRIADLESDFDNEMVATSTFSALVRLARAAKANCDAPRDAQWVLSQRELRDAIDAFDWSDPHTATAASAGKNTGESGEV